eukprot:1157901-Pelagomonas_calceolata.AAC.3
MDARFQAMQITAGISMVQGQGAMRTAYLWDPQTARACCAVPVCPGLKDIKRLCNPASRMHRAFTDLNRSFAIHHQSSVDGSLPVCNMHELHRQARLLPNIAIFRTAHR